MIHFLFMLVKFIILQIRTPYNLILVNLAVVEFLLAFFGVSMDVLALIQDGWQYGKDLCMAQGALVTTAGISLINCESRQFTKLFYQNDRINKC